MGTTSLETVLRCLQEAGFPADGAYPGQKLPQISEAVAAFHIHEINSSKQTETIEVSILCPAHMGGAACEEAALRATAALQAAGASCIQKGCQYDGLAQLYRIAIFATFSQAPEEETNEPGFQIQLDSVSHPWAVAFSAEKVQVQTPEFITRSPEAVAITSGSYHWKICLEEQIPYGSQESGEALADFVLRVTRGTGAEIYSPCRWSSVTRSFTAEGLRLIRKGIALTRKEVSA